MSPNKITSIICVMFLALLQSTTTAFQIIPSTMTTNSKIWYPVVVSKIDVGPLHLSSKQENGFSLENEYSIFDKAQLVFKEFRELEASGKADSVSPLEIMNDDNNEEPKSFVESILIQTAADVGRRIGKVFGGALPENYKD